MGENSAWFHFFVVGLSCYMFQCSLLPESRGRKAWYQLSQQVCSSACSWCSSFSIRNGTRKIRNTYTAHNTSELSPQKGRYANEDVSNHRPLLSPFGIAAILISDRAFRHWIWGNTQALNMELLISKSGSFCQKSQLNLLCLLLKWGCCRRN